ncbi:MAG TPA: GerMN domain-containing protein [Motilibacteraceae bacterium]|nr:GerMN domain-containing protein [Motilibacteraceae bacterium]
MSGQPGRRVPDGTDLEDLVRRALHEEAASVEPAGDGLARIREGVLDDGSGDGTGSGRRRMLLAVAAAGVAVLAGVGVALAAGRGDDSTVATPPTPTSAPTTTASTAPSPSPSASASPTGGGAGSPTASAGGALPVYYVADVAGQTRLYREFHAPPSAPGDAGRAALEEMLHAQPVDPDYTSLWPRSTSIVSYEVSDGTATVDLSSDALSVSAGPEQTTASVQQLVYTLTAADPAVKRVRLLVGGQQVKTLWGHPVGDQPLERAPALDVQGLIWIIDPAQGTTSGSPVTVRVYGTAFEGNVVLKVFRGASEVESTFVTAAMGSFAEASTEIDLAPGTYSLRAYDENAKDGTLTERDSKDFTVR